MFRKIVSNLPYSPALVGQLGFYARRLRKEEATRQLGLMFTVLALVVQSFAVFQPPTAANASSSADFVSGGISSKSDFLEHYDRNDRNIKDLFTSLGITRQEIKDADSDTIGESGYYNWSMTSLYSESQGQDTYKFYDSDGDSHKVYNRPMSLTKEGRAPYPVFEGHSAKFGYFAIKKDCGNLITKKQPPDQEKPTPPPPPPPPTIVRRASCSALRVTIANRENVNLTGQASVQNATISRYIFVVKDASGRVVKTTSVSSRGVSAQADSFTIKKPGSYTARLTVTTSLGEVSDSTRCVKAFTIAPPAVCQYNPSLPANDSRCQPCPDSDTPNLWISSPECNEQFIYSKKAVNIDQSSTNATSVVAQTSDRIQYTLTIVNKGHTSGKTPITENLTDVLEYSSLFDLGGGTFDQTTKTLSWPDTTILPGKEETRVFIVKLASNVPAMNTGTSNGASYDCKMINTFGNSVEIQVNCPIQKLVVEQVTRELPHTGPRENVIFAGIVFTIVTYFYVRSRQLNKEVRLIRKDLAAGTI